MNITSPNFTHQQPCKKALIIDPFPTFCRALHKLIRNHIPNVEIVETDNLDRAYVIFKTKSPDIVFLDTAIFPKNSSDYIRSIKQQIPTTPIVVLTTHDSAEHKTASLQCGVDYFFSKSSSSTADLMDVIKRVLEPG